MWLLLSFIISILALYWGNQIALDMGVDWITPYGLIQSVPVTLQLLFYVVFQFFSSISKQIILVEQKTVLFIGQ